MSISSALSPPSDFTRSPKGVCPGFRAVGLPLSTQPQYPNPILMASAARRTVPPLRGSLRSSTAPLPSGLVPISYILYPICCASAHSPPGRIRSSAPRRIIPHPFGSWIGLVALHLPIPAPENTLYSCLNRSYWPESQRIPISVMESHASGDSDTPWSSFWRC